MPLKPKKLVLNKRKAIRNMRPDQYRVVTDQEGNKTRESHLMEYNGDISKRRGNFRVYPSIAPKKGKEKSRNPSDWVSQGEKGAQERGEVITVRSRRKAEKLAAGSWKKGQDKKDAMKELKSQKKMKK